MLKNHELKPGGKDITVTEENKREYVRLYVNYRFMRGIEQQFLALQKGFHELIPPLLLRPFDERELELVIGGLGTIDINDWKMHTRLKHCTPDTSVVQWFWQIVESYGEEMRARLLQFVTGSSRVPLQGFKALQGKFSNNTICKYRLRGYQYKCFKNVFFLFIKYVKCLEKFSGQFNIYVHCIEFAIFNNLLI